MFINNTNASHNVSVPWTSPYVLKLEDWREVQGAFPPILAPSNHRSHSLCPSIIIRASSLVGPAATCGGRRSGAGGDQYYAYMARATGLFKSGRVAIHINCAGACTHPPTISYYCHFFSAPTTVLRACSNDSVALPSSLAPSGARMQ